MSEQFRILSFASQLFLLFFFQTSHAEDFSSKAGLSFSNCTSPQFNSTGSKLFYSCQMKERHSQFQIYEFDISTKTEKRMTFDDGDSLYPFPFRDQLFYFSNTDSIKRASFSPSSTAAVQDLFSLNLRSKDITALTEQNSHRENPQMSRFSIYWSERQQSAKTSEELKWFSMDLETKKVHSLNLPSTLVVKNLIQIGKTDWILIGSSEIFRWSEKSKAESVIKAEVGDILPTLYSQNQDGALINLKIAAKPKESEPASEWLWISNKDICAVKAEGLSKDAKQISINPMNPSQVALTFVQGNKTRIEVKSLKLDLGTCGSLQISSKLEK